MDLEILIRFLLAAVWGGLVGAEREYHGKSAGFRTMIMISLGSCFFTMMSIWIGGEGNPDRIAANIVTGIGFLGAGVIFRGDNKINGITTAATIWTVAAVGMGIGAGYYFASGMASIMVLIILAILPSLEKKIDKLNQYKIYTIYCDAATDRISYFEQTLKNHHLKFKLLEITKEDLNLRLKFQVRGSLHLHKRFIDAILLDDAVKKFEY